MAAIDERPEIVITHPNQDKASSKTMKWIVVLLLVVSAVLTLIILVGGWEKLVGMKAIQAGFVIVYLVMAFFVARWKSGVLPLAAALAVLLGIFAAIAGPEWLARDKPGFESPAIDDAILGTLTLLVVPLQILVVACAMSAFRQGWQVEVDVPRDQYKGGAVARNQQRPATA